MKYKNNLKEFFEGIYEEKCRRQGKEIEWEKENPDIINTNINNMKKGLKKILYALDLECILDTSEYKKGREKFLPENIQILLRVLLLNDNDENKLIKKLKNNKFEKIKDSEVDEFVENLEEEFNTYIRNISVDDKCENLDKINDCVFEAYEDEELYMIIEDPKWIQGTYQVYGEDYRKFVENAQLKAELLYKRNETIQNINQKINTKIEIEQLLKEFEKDIRKKIIKTFELDDLIKDYVDVVEEYNSFTGSEIEIPAKILKAIQEGRPLDHHKVRALKKFVKDFDEYLESWKKSLKDEVEEDEKKRKKRLKECY